MEKYQPNSHKSKELSTETPKERRVEKVVTGKVTTKKNEGRKFADIFISEDAGNVKEFIIMDLLVPSIKNLFSSVIKESVDMLFFGRSGGSGNRNGATSNKVSYRRYYDERNNDFDHYGYRPKSRFEYEDIVFPSRGDAEVVRKHMLATIDRYGMVTVGDMYDMAGLGDQAPYTAHDYGWTMLRNVEPRRAGNGYILTLPKAMPID